MAAAELFTTKAAFVPLTIVVRSVCTKITARSVIAANDIACVKGSVVAQIVRAPACHAGDRQCKTGRHCQIFGEAT